MHNDDIKALLLSLVKLGINFSLEADQKLILKGDLSKLDEPNRLLLKTHKEAIKAYIRQRQQQSQLQITKRRNSGPAPLSFAQQRLWLIDQLEENRHQYNMLFALTLSGDFDRNLLQQTMDCILSRHDILRTCYLTDEDGQPLQQVQPASSVPVRYVDFSSLSEPDAQQRSRDIAIQDASQPFDLSQDILLRVTLIKWSDQSHILLLNMHHIASDGWSMGVLSEEFITLYHSFHQGLDNPLPPLAIQYADYACWQREWLQDQELTRQLDYWRAQLADLPGLHSLQPDTPRPKQQSFRGAVHISQLDATLCNALQQLSRAHDVTLFMTLQAAFSLLLSRFSNNHDIVLGTPIANRTQAELTPLIGCFLNTLVLRNDLSGNPAFTDLLARTKKMTLDAYEHQHVPFDMLVDKLQPARSNSYAALYQIMFVLQNNSQREVSLPDLTVAPFDYDFKVAKYDIHLAMEENATGLQATWTYCADLFEPETIRVFDQHLHQLLSAIVTTPEQNIQQLALLPEAAKRQLLSAAQMSTTEVALEQHVLAKLDAYAQACPQAIALRCQEQQLTYLQLQEKTNRLAHYLQEDGMQPGDRVGLYFERSIHFMVSMLAALRAGLCYVPFEPKNSKDRLSHIIQDADITLVLVQSSLLPNLPVAGIDVLQMDDVLDESWLTEYPATAPDTACCQPDDTAYIIYTSGSTGQPKGVEVTHRALMTYLQHGIDHYFTSQLQGSMVLTSHGFDLSIPSLYLPLLTGGEVNLLPAQWQLDDIADELKQCSHHYLLRMTPEHAQGLLSLLPEDQNCTNQHVMVIGGSEFPLKLARQLQQQFPNSQIYNHYGPTETVVGCVMFDVSTNLSHLEHQVPLGRAMDNVRLYVLNEQQQLAPPGALGELCIGGMRLAKGYLNNPEFTAEKFIANPFVNGERLYRSGDLVRRLPDGNLVFMGRVDHQLKIRGFRVEPGEIEQQALQTAGVKQALALIRDPKQSQSLLLYVVAEDVAAMASGQLQQSVVQRLQASLPDYMQPDHVIVLDFLPLTASGKVDRKNLPAGDATVVQKTMPETETELAIANIWQTLLGIEHPGADQSFFALGGHSLLLTRLVSTLNQQFSVCLKIKDIFEHNTIARQALLIAQADQAQQVLIPTCDHDRPLPLSFA
ncbi:amino acid adenylation domain-containing protein, partial [Rheinheimera baltica]|uniref:non-ribosomal peptide synthetase n=1 Tax=Rheinheimera baltica TaxID=67576 RepID=UPI00273FA11D